MLKQAHSSRTGLLLGLFFLTLLSSCSSDTNPITPVSCATGPAAPAPYAASFTSLGFLPGDIHSEVMAASWDGSVLVGTSISSTNRKEAFSWNVQQGMTGLGFLPGGTYSTASAVSADGSVVVGDGDNSTSRVVFRWTASTGQVPLSMLPGSAFCVSGDVSGDGSVVVGTCLTINNEAFRWTESTGSVSLGQFGTGSGGNSSAAAISSNGEVIAGSGQFGVVGAVLWTSNGVIFLGNPSSAATAASQNGSVIVGYADDKAFCWNQQLGIVDISEPLSGFVTSVATGVSGDGQLIVGWGTTSDGEAAFIWDAHNGMRRLDTVLSSDFATEIMGWKLTRATAISGDGLTIVGYGTNPSGLTEGWVVGLSSRTE